ncbi:hypothetical protein RRG08_017370 [Elysia crispata]|uniref:Uncharacterized protein n=1 Tax=Elysia crispata TaxID=231223 RepID=A0AAE1AM49_9GAST|nr:hypothetical protein RRG08_017370 [Elysia crispata]
MKLLVRSTSNRAPSHGRGSEAFQRIRRQPGFGSSFSYIHRHFFQKGIFCLCYLYHGWKVKVSWLDLQQVPVTRSGGAKENHAAQVWSIKKHRDIDRWRHKYSSRGLPPRSRRLPPPVPLGKGGWTETSRGVKKSPGRNNCSLSVTFFVMVSSL